MLALWAIVGEELFDEIEKDGLSKLGYEIPGVDSFLVYPPNRICVAYTGTKWLDKTTDEILRNSTEAEAIFALLAK